MLFNSVDFLCIKARVRSAGNVTVITRNLPGNLRVGKIENYDFITHIVNVSSV